MKMVLFAIWMVTMAITSGVMWLAFFIHQNQLWDMAFTATVVELFVGFMVYQIAKRG